MPAPQEWLLDRVPTLTEVVESTPRAARQPQTDADARIDDAVDAAVAGALQQWREQIEPRLTQFIADAVEQAVRDALESRSAGRHPPAAGPSVEEHDTLATSRSSNPPA